MKRYDYYIISFLGIFLICWWVYILHSSTYQDVSELKIEVNELKQSINRSDTLLIKIIKK